MTRKTRPPEPPNSSSNEGKMVNNYPGAGQNNLREMTGKRGMQAEPPNELAPHIQRATSNLSQNALQQQQDYTNQDFKLLENRISQKLQAMQQQYVAQLREAEDRIYSKIYEVAEWSNNQNKVHLATTRNDIINSVCGDAEDGFEVTQPMEEDHNGLYGAGKPPRPRPPQRTPMRRTGTPLWAGNMPRQDTFSPQTREGYVPNAVSRTMSMPQTFVQATPFRSFQTGGLESMMGTQMSGVAPQGLNVAVKKQRLKSETSQLGMPGSQQTHSQNSQQNNSQIPKYKLSRAIKTVPDLWLEWTVGFQGGPSVKELEELYKSSWRNGMAERQFFSRRKVVIDEICKRGDELYQEALKKREARKQYLQAMAESNPGSAHELQSMQDDTQLWDECHKKAAADLDAERGRMSLNALSGKLRKQKNAERGIGASFSQDADGNHEDDDAEGDENEDEGTQMTDTQYTDGGNSQNPNTRQHADLMDLEHSHHPPSQPPQHRAPPQQNHQRPQPRRQQAPVAPMVPADNSLRDVISLPHNHRGGNSNGSSEGQGAEGDDMGDHFQTFEGFVEVEGMERVGEMEEHVGKKRRVE